MTRLLLLTDEQCDRMLSALELRRLATPNEAEQKAIAEIISIVQAQLAAHPYQEPGPGAVEFQKIVDQIRGSSWREQPKPMFQEPRSDPRGYTLEEGRCGLFRDL